MIEKGEVGRHGEYFVGGKGGKVEKKARTLTHSHRQVMKEGKREGGDVF